MHANVQKIQFGGTYNPAQVSVFNTVGIHITFFFFTLLYRPVRFPARSDFLSVGGSSRFFAGFIPSFASMLTHGPLLDLPGGDELCFFCSGEASGEACEFFGFWT